MTLSLEKWEDLTSHNVITNNIGRGFMYNIVFMRHGQSQWNLEDRFTGWVDVDLTEKGRQEAQIAAQLLIKAGFQFDMAYTSVLKRAIRSLWIILSELDQMWLPVHKSWHFNERHYGALQGLNKKDTIKKYGEDQVFAWRRSYSTSPPDLPTENPQHPLHDKRYQELENLPHSEALADTQARVLPFWYSEVVPKIKSGQRILVVAHGNSLRALVKHLNQIPDEEISQLNIPTGRPLIYELNKDLLPIKNYYL